RAVLVREGAGGRRPAKVAAHLAVGDLAVGHVGAQQPRTGIDTTVRDIARAGGHGCRQDHAGQVDVGRVHAGAVGAGARPGAGGAAASTGLLGAHGAERRGVGAAVLGAGRVAVAGRAVVGRGRTHGQRRRSVAARVGAAALATAAL